METKLWQECLCCKDKCCKWDLDLPVFLTSGEKRKLPKINTQYFCPYFNQKGLCDVYDIKPFDCKIFPFDIWKYNGRFIWGIWKVNCPIVKKREEFELYLQRFEQELIPKFKNHLRDYEKFEPEWERKGKYQYEILREVRFSKKDEGGTTP